MLTVQILDSKATRKNLSNEVKTILNTVYTLATLVQSKALPLKVAQKSAEDLLLNEYADFEIEAAYSFVIDSEDEAQEVHDDETIATGHVMIDLLGPLF